MTEPVLAIEHPRFRTVETAIFTRRLADCMSHRCTTVETGVHKFDVCCQYGCDVDLHERAAIERRAEAVRALLRDDAKHVPWFETEETADPDYPSGLVVRSQVHQGACVFLAHDQRGCALHRAAIEHAWPLGEIKPAICRLYPVSYLEDAIIVAEEYPEYSCAHTDGETLYRLSRDTLGELFGAPLIAALDALEAKVLAGEPRRLPIAQ